MTTAFRVFARYLGAAATYKWQRSERDNVVKLVNQLMDSESVTVSGDVENLDPKLLEKNILDEIVWVFYYWYERHSEDIAAGKHDKKDPKEYDEILDTASRYREASYDVKKMSVSCTKKGKTIVVKTSPGIRDYQKKHKLPEL